MQDYRALHYDPLCLLCRCSGLCGFFQTAEWKCDRQQSKHRLKRQQITFRLTSFYGQWHTETIQLQRHGKLCNGHCIVICAVTCVLCLLVSDHVEETQIVWMCVHFSRSMWWNCMNVGTRLILASWFLSRGPRSAPCLKFMQNFLYCVLQQLMQSNNARDTW